MITQIQQDTMVKMYEDGASATQIASEIKCSNATVLNHLKKRNIYQIKYLRWTDSENIFLQENYAKHGSTFCSEKLNRTRQAVIDHAGRVLKIKMEKTCFQNLRLLQAEKNRKHVINTDLFVNVKFPEEAYVLGFLWADGSLRNGVNGDNAIRLVIKKDDADDIRSVMRHSGDWPDITYLHKKNQNYVTKFSYCHKFFYQYLLSLGFLTKSGGSAEKVLLSIPEDLRHYWWRGYFDGDGGVCRTKKTVSITSTFDQDWSFLSYLPIENLLEKRVKRNTFKTKEGKEYRYSRLTICGKDVDKFAQYIYQGQWFGLKRKLDRFISLGCLPGTR